MTDYIKTAQQLFAEGCNCSQSVFATFATELGIERDAALKLASGFGGGMGRQGEACGAVSGAVMALGLARGSSDPQDKEAKERTYALITHFLEEFRAGHGGLLRCPDLLGVDIDHPDGLQAARDQNLFKTICPQLVVDAAAITARLLEETP